MSLIVSPKTVRVLIPLAVGYCLLFYVFVGNWGADESPASDEEISIHPATQKTQPIKKPFRPNRTKRRQSNMHRLPIPLQQSKEKLSQAPLNPTTNRSWSAEVYLSSDDPYLLTEEFNHILKSAGSSKNSDLQILGRRAILVSSDLSLDLLGQLPTIQDKLAFLEGIVSQLLASSPTEAIAWAEGSLDTDMKKRAFGLIGKLYAMQNPADAAEWASEIENPTLRIKTYKEIALVWGASDIDSAYNWALRLEDYGEQSSVLFNLGVALARDSPPAAANWALTFEDQRLGNKILAKALNKWSVGNLPDVGQWVAELPESPTKNFAVSHISTLWAQLNPSNAYEWAETLLTSQTRDLAISSIATMSSKSDPERAASNALGIEDDGLRHITLAKVLKNWGNQEPFAPVRWIESIQNPSLRNELELLIQQM